MKSSSRSITHSIKGRIWLAAGSLAFTNSLLALGTFAALWFLSADVYVSLFAAVSMLAVTTVAFGWWLAADVVRPIEEVSLLARSLERSPSTSLPRTTGAIETDQLLQTLHRNGQQLRNLISVMDDVAAGKTEAATMPLESSDKLSASFQKLVSKVTDSISAKRELDELRSAIVQLSDDTSKLRSGHLELAIRSEHPQTKDLSNVVRYLATRLSGVTQQIYASTSECERAAAEARSSLQSGLESVDHRAVPAIATSIDNESKLDPLLSRLSILIKQSTEVYDKYAEQGANSPRAATVSQDLRTKVDESSRLLQRLRDRISGVTQLGRHAQDLARRTNLIAMNASIASVGTTSADILADELHSLSTRTDELHKQILLTGESLNGEIAGIEKEMSSLSESAPEISRALNSSIQISYSLFEHISNIAEIEQELETAHRESKLDMERMKGAIEKLSDVSLTSAMIRESEASVQRLSGLVGSLRESISDLRISGTARVSSVSPTAPLPTQNPTPSDTRGEDTAIKRITEAKHTAEISDPTTSQASSLAGFNGLIDMSAHFGEN